jgi:protein-tyrosine phosphatase
MVNESAGQPAPTAQGPRSEDERPQTLAGEAQAEEAITLADSAAPPQLSGNSLLRRGFARWLVMGGVRLLYRWWTRVAVHLFPENTKRAALAERIGIPLPDSLNMSWITPHLAVGGRIHPEDIARLAGTGITRVVDTRSEHHDDEHALGDVGIGLLYLPAPDTFPLSVEQLCEGANWINGQIDNEQRVLVHCEHGVGRSVLLTAAALVQSGLSASEALSLIQRKRWQSAPNHRQMRRLQEFERAIRSGSAC